jgi:hypothetical protein
MKEDPNVRATGASVEAATEYTTYADVAGSYVARSLESSRELGRKMAVRYLTELSHQYELVAIYLSILRDFLDMGLWLSH